MAQELRWRVVYGYNPNDHVSIDESYLEKAKYAMLSGKLFNYKMKTIRGSEIKRVEPDIRFYTGWYDTYNFGGSEDQAQIERDVPLQAIEERTYQADNRVGYILRNNKPQLLNDISSVDKLLIE